MVLICLGVSRIDRRLLQAIAAAEPSGSRLFKACEEHTMTFPDEQDSIGRWVVPASFPICDLVGDHLEHDVEYQPPLLPTLPYNPFKALVVPRPIGWISTRGDSGDNLSPYSFFGYLSNDVVFYGVGGEHADGGEKDALRDARFSGVFCVNVVSWDLRAAMSASSAEASRSVDEFYIPIVPECLEGMTEALKGACKHINAPCVSNAPLRMECEVLQFVSMADKLDVAVVGKIVHVEGSMEGAVAARGGYMNYYRIGKEHGFDSLDEEASW